MPHNRWDSPGQEGQSLPWLADSTFVEKHWLGDPCEPPDPPQGWLGRWHSPCFADVDPGAQGGEGRGWNPVTPGVQVLPRPSKLPLPSLRVKWAMTVRISSGSADPKGPILSKQEG